MKVPNYITNHVNFNEDDYCYLVAKGWTNREIEDRWNQEAASGKSACSWNSTFAKAKLNSVLG